MGKSFLQNIFADRIGGKQFGQQGVAYKFIRIKLAKRKAQTDNPSISLIDMGVGEPDGMADLSVVKALSLEAGKLENRIYADSGCREFRVGVGGYMKRLFGVDLDPDTEVLHCIGSKAALSILPACFINPGDITLMTVPSFPIFGEHAIYYGGEVYPLPLVESNHFLPDLEAIPPEVVKRSKVLLLNYPNNPTGAVATKAFFEKAVAWAKKNEVIIIQDAAYGALVLQGERLSILQIPGAKDIALEVHSLSKSHNMTGWRIGWVCGNASLVKAYEDVKGHTDSGQFLGIQKAAVVALGQPEITERLIEKYARRMDLMLNLLQEVGFPAKPSPATFFLYIKAPKQAKDGANYTFNTAEEFSHWLIERQLISTVPWDDAGAYVRFSLTYEAATPEDEIKVMAELKRRLSHYQFTF